MSFAAPLWLMLLGLVPLIIWFHVRRREPLEVPSTRLWHLVGEGEHPQAALRPPPLSLALVLQLLAVLTLSMTLAEPRFGWTERGPTVIVVDASILMAVNTQTGSSRHDDATALLADALRRWEAPWSLWRLAEQAEPVLLERTALHEVRHAITEMRPSHVPAAWDMAAEQIVATLPPGGRMVIVTAEPDRASAAFRAIEATSSWTLEVRNAGGPFTSWAIEDVHVEPDPSRSGRWLIEGLVRRYGPDDGRPPEEVIVGFLPDIADEAIELDRVPLAYSLAGTARVRAAIDATRPGILSLAVDVDDDFTADDRVSLRIDPAPTQVNVAVVGPDGPGRSRVERAVDALGYGRSAPTEADVVIVAGGPAPDPSPFTALVWLGTAEGVDDPRTLPRVDPGVANWQPQHPVATSTSWNRVHADAARDLPLPSDAEPVVEGVSSVLVATRTTTDRREVWSGLTPDDVTWTESSGFITFIGDALTWLAATPRATAWCTVGAPCEVPRVVATNAGDVSVDGRVVARWKTEHSTLPADVTTAWVPEHAGVAVWQAGDHTGRLAVQLPSASRAALASGAEAVPVSTASVPPRWPDVRVWLVLAAIIVVAEAFIAGRGREGFWRVAQWRGPSLLARRRRTTAAWQVALTLLLVAALLTAPWPVTWTSARLIVVGPVPEGVPWPADRVRSIEGDPATSIVDLERALTTARALAGNDATSVVWATEAPPTRGSTVRALVQPTASDLRVDALPPAERPTGDVAVEHVTLDRAPFAGDTVTLSAVLRTPAETTTRLRVLRDELTLIDVDVDLALGANLVSLPVPTPMAGPVRWRVEVDTVGDPFAGNDASELLTDVRHPPRVWVMTTESDRGESLADALRLQGFTVTVRPAFALPTALNALEDVDTIVLANVPALELTSLQQDTLETWVRERGGGLVIAGGERSFGPGGYIETPLDLVSPLSARVPRDAPEVGIIFVLDRSGSMQQMVGSATRLDIAKEATLRATELLGPGSQLAIVVFDEEARLLLPWTSSDDVHAIEGALAPLVPGGGTAIAPGLEVARELVADTDAASVHVVLMTDGLSQPGDMISITHMIRAADATVSAVAIGLGADVDTIREIARVGGGASHVTTDFRALPGILAQEALLLSGDPVVREVVSPRRVDDDHPAMAGLPAVFPPLSAFVETTPKLDADVLLSDSEERPILATWRYGAGNVMAFTSQGIGPWVDGWTSVDAFARWWGQWTRWTVQPTHTTGLALQATVVGDALYVVVDARDEAGGARPGLDLEATWQPASGGGTVRRLAELMDGRYTVTLPIDPGSGTLTVRARDTTLDPVATAVTHTYPASWAGSLRDDARVLVEWTGGSMLTGADALTPRRGQVVFGWVPSWRPWVVLMVMAWLVSLMVRYVPGWLRRRTRATSPPSAVARLRSRAKTATTE